MKICVSEFIFQSFQDLLIKSLKGHDILLIDKSGALPSGSEKPQVVFASYEVMFKCLHDEVYRNKFLSLISGIEFVQGSWAGIESEVAQQIISSAKKFSHGGGLHAIPLANYVFSQMLRHVKGIDEHIELQKNKEWKQLLLTGELTDLTIGIAGYGGIGKEVARLAKAFRMQVIATKRTKVKSKFLDKLFKPSDLNKMLKKSDFVVNCLPATEETNKIFSLHQFLTMKKTAMFINVGRGETVNEEDLIHALTKGEISCAALDTTDPEPLSANSPLWELKNCFITPHDSAWGPKAPQRAVDLFLKNIKRIQAGREVINLV